jgi:hypothetical protein
VTIRRRIVFRAVAAASIAGAVVVPVVIAIVELILGSVHVVEIVAGALVGTLFFAVSGVVAAIYQNSPSLRTAVLLTYVIKTSMLFGIGMSLRLDHVNRPTLAASTAASAVIYVAVQSLMITQRNRRFRKI